MTARWITAALLLVASPLMGQEPEPVLEPGAKVRLTDSSFVVVGHVEEFDGAQLSVRVEETERRRGSLDAQPWERGDLAYWPVSNIDRLELRTGARGHFWTGAIIGAVVVGLPAALLGAALGEEYAENTKTHVGAVLGSAAAGIVVGGLVGGGIGALIRTNKWEPVELPAKPIVAVHPTGRFSVGVSIPLRR